MKWGGYAELIRLLREQLSVPVAEAHVTDLNEVGGNTDLHVRERVTRRLLALVARGQDVRLILDRPVLTLEVAGQTAYLEPDALTHRIDGTFHVVLIRSFAAIDGQANPTAVAETAKQAAVYVLSLRRAFETGGLPTDQLAHDFLLVCPKDFSNRPYARLVDLRQELDALQFQLSRPRRAEDLAARLPETASCRRAATSPIAGPSTGAGSPSTPSTWTPTAARRPAATRPSAPPAVWPAWRTRSPATRRSAHTTTRW